MHTSAELRDAIASGTASVLLLVGDAPFAFSTSIATAIGPTALLVNRSVVLVAPVGGVAVLDANAGAAKPRRVLTIVGADVVVELRGVALTGGFSTEWGGGARVEAGAELRLVQSAVRGCVVRTAGTKNARGGGVLVSGGARLTVLDGSRVSNNTAVAESLEARGGGLAINAGGSALLSGSTIDGNTALAEGSIGSAFGGGVFVSIGGTAVLSASAVDGNTARAKGGSFSVLVGAHAAGGGVSVGGGEEDDGKGTRGTLNARDGTSISSNTVVSGYAAEGGGLQIDARGTVVLSASAVDGNTARAEGSGTASGGGVFVSIGGTAVLSASAVDGNTARALGSGVAVGGGVINVGTLTASNGASIDGNLARAEGAGAAGGGGVINGGTFVARDGTSISRNTAVSVGGKVQGGGLSIDPGGTAVLSASAVDGNTARAKGSGIAAGGGVVNIGGLTVRNGSSISNNTAVSVTGTARGGGLSIEQGCTAVISASAVDSNTARAEGRGVALAGGVFIKGSLDARDGTSISHNAAVNIDGLAASGGGLLIDDNGQYIGGTAVLSASFVDGNTARAEGRGADANAFGGGVAVQSPGGDYGTNAFSARDGTSISHNTAVSLWGIALGGGVVADPNSIEGGGSIALRDSSVLNNTALSERAADGGGLAIFGNLTARNATIVGNRALAANGTCRGGGLFHAGRPALLHGGVIDGNVAVGRVVSGSQVLDWL